MVIPALNKVLQAPVYFGDKDVVYTVDISLIEGPKHTLLQDHIAHHKIICPHI